MNAKIYKILPHKFLDCDISIWVDGNIFLNIPSTQLVEEWLGNADMAVLKHYHRESIYWEIKWVDFKFRHNRDSQILKDAEKQVAYYKSIGIPKKTGMYSCGFIIRRHNKAVNQFNERWWAEITRWSSQDQISFPIVKLEFPGLKINPIIGDIRNHPYLRYEKHQHFNV